MRPKSLRGKKGVFLWLFQLLLICLPLINITYVIGQPNVYLARPTQKSITFNILSKLPIEYSLAFGKQPDQLLETTGVGFIEPEIPTVFTLDGLDSNTRYYYQIQYRKSQSTESYQLSDVYHFQTRRSKGASFTFTIEGDEHLYDKKGILEVYQQCLSNQKIDAPDFMLTLGDTFGDDHTPETTTSQEMKELHEVYRIHWQDFSHSIPIFICLGNHEGENGYFLNQNPPNNIAHYGTYWRKYFFPNPIPNQFYSGNVNQEGFGIGYPENYYSWEWGNAQFIVLDVYRDCDVNEKPKNWDWSLGFEQYKWLENALSNSAAPLKFVFAHHTRGQGRGGVTTADGFEWGGMDAGRDRFNEYRPGWGLPIHQLMVKHGVDVFFQGHDHVYAQETLDGLVYQTVPMPSDSTYELGYLANADAFIGKVLKGSGHLQVQVKGECATVAFVNTVLERDEALQGIKNRDIGAVYEVGDCLVATENTSSIKTTQYNIYPNPAIGFLYIEPIVPINLPIHVTLFTPNGVPLITTHFSDMSATTVFPLAGIPSGIYILKLLSSEGIEHKVMTIH